MIDQPPPELFSERPVRSDFTRVRTYRIRRIVTSCVAIALIGGGAYSIYLWKRGPREIPTIKAELPLKQKPEQPGGIDIPNQDVLAYQQIDNSAAKPPVEHLLPPPETPQPQATVSAAPAPTTPSVENLLTPSPSTSAAVAAAEAPQNAPNTFPPTTAPTPEAAPVSTVEKTADASPPAAPEAAPPAPAPVVVAPAPVAPHAAATTGRKGFRIQLASFPDKELASQQLGRMQSKYAAALGPARLHLAKADLGARGIYYRVQSNPITDTQARDICEALKKSRMGCIVVKP